MGALGLLRVEAEHVWFDHVFGQPDVAKAIVVGHVATNPPRQPHCFSSSAVTFEFDGNKRCVLAFEDVNFKDAVTDGYVVTNLCNNPRATFGHEGVRQSDFNRGERDFWCPFGPGWQFDFEFRYPRTIRFSGNPNPGQFPIFVDQVALR